MYVAGVLTPNIIHRMEDQDSEFMNAYYDKGWLSKALETIPLFVVTVNDLGVRGVCECGHRVSFVVCIIC